MERDAKDLEAKDTSVIELSIVGISCHFPGGVNSPGDYWAMLQNGTQTSSYIPFDRWDAFSVGVNSNLNKKEKMQILYGSFVDGIEKLDPSVFKISKDKAVNMSPL